MKKLFVTSVIAIAATVAVANTPIDLKKVNKIIAKVVRAELTPLINAAELKIDEKSNLESVKDLKTAVSLSATATHSKWSKYKTSLDLKTALKTTESDDTNTKVDFLASLGSKTDAVSLFSYAAGVIAKDLSEDTELSPIEKEFLPWFLTASETKKLDQIPAQLEQFVVLLKKLVAVETPENPDEDWTAYAQLVNSLTVDTKINNYKTIEVIVKTNQSVTIKDNVISSLSLVISEKGLSLNGHLTFLVATADVASTIETVRNLLISIQTADKDTIEDLRTTARSYIAIVSGFAKGEEN